MQWIFEFPIDGLPVHVLNLRQILQASTGSSTTKENEELATAKAGISAKVQGFFPYTQVPKASRAQSYELSQLSQTIKSALGRWVRRTVASQLLFHQTDTAQYDALRVGRVKGPFILISPEQFGNIRSILENLDEYPILADVIKICTNTVDITVLTAASNTVNYHFEIFSAIGAASDLFQALYNRYEDSYSQTVKQKLLTESLIDLDCRLSHSSRGRSHLRPKLLIYEQNAIPAACSPISDYMSEPLHPSESAFIDAVEQSFTSGTLMEDQVLEQVFKKTTTRLQQSWNASEDKSVNNLTDLLLRLRNYGVSLFEKLLSQWLDEFFASRPRPRLRDVMPSFICAGVTRLSTLLERIMTAYDAVADEERVAGLAIEAFELLTISAAELEPLVTSVRLHGRCISLR